MGKLKTFFSKLFKTKGIKTNEDILKQKRMIIVGVIVGFAFLGLGTSFYSFSQKQKKLLANQPINSPKLITERDKEYDWKDNIEQKVNTLKTENTNLSEENSALRTEINELKNMFSEKTLTRDELEEYLAGQSVVQNNTTTDNSSSKDEPALPAPPFEENESGKPVVNLDLLPAPPSPYPGYSAPGYVAPDVARKSSETEAAVAPESGSSIHVYRPENPPVSEEDNASEKFFLPAGTFMSGVLLGGLNAPTSAGGNTNPLPVFINVRSESFMPNSAISNNLDCFVIGSAMGELSDYRVYIRLVKLSCVNKARTHAISAEIQGGVLGEDGKHGVEGRAVSKQGALLAKTFLAGFMEGFGKVFQNAASSVSTDSSGSVSTIDPGKSFEAAGFGGLAESFDKLSDFYLNMAKRIFPVIELNAGRKVTVVLQNEKEVVWEKRNIVRNPLDMPIGGE